MFQKFETKIFGRRAILREVEGGVDVELIGRDESKEILDAMAQNIADHFEGVFETPDHPSTSHVRLIRIRRENIDLSKFITKLRRSITY